MMYDKTHINDHSQVIHLFTLSLEYTVDCLIRGNEAQSNTAIIHVVEFIQRNIMAEGGSHKFSR